MLLSIIWRVLIMLVCLASVACVLVSDTNNEISPFRDYLKIYKLGKDGADAMKLHLTLHCSNYSKNAKKGYQESIKAANKEMKENNLFVGENPLISLFNWQYERKINSFFQSLCPDYLHTVSKGIVEYAITCLQVISFIGHNNYGDNMIMLDTRCSNFL